MTLPSEDPRGSLDLAMRHAESLLGARPDLAIKQALEILKVHREFPAALCMLSAGLRRIGDLDSARQALAPLLRSSPVSAKALLELGMIESRAGNASAAISAFEAAVRINADLSEAWLALGDLHLAADSLSDAEFAYTQSTRASISDPELSRAALALVDGDLPNAETLLKTRLKSRPTDVAAIRMLGELAARLGRFGDAESLFTRCLELAPGFIAARHHRAIVLYRSGRIQDALGELDQLLSQDPENPGYRTLKAAAMVQLGEYQQALDLYGDILGRFPNQPKAWMSYGHTLKTVGRLDDSISAYRRSLSLAPGFGEAWWSLANLKTFRFEVEDMQQMQSGLTNPDTTPDDRLHLHFALGKAFEDAGSWSESFLHYDQANAIRRDQLGYDRHLHTQLIDRICTHGNLDPGNRSGAGDGANDPIFVLGMPRAGSTLVEQILSSHSQVEGTMELPDITTLANRLTARARSVGLEAYIEMLEDLSDDECAALGAEYLQRTRPQRKLGRPRFIDKMPNNFLHIGLIHRILPNATIIDVRRHPLACCFSGFKQHFARGQAFSFGQEDIGAYYQDYVRLMAHFDHVLPGRIHRVHYETLVSDPEIEIRRMLDHCGLAFETGCLSHHTNDRAVRTPSSEQVRQPIYTEGLDHWRHFEPWLTPLKVSLGEVLDRYPETPFDHATKMT